jgi:hypothetical protein
VKQAAQGDEERVEQSIVHGITASKNIMRRDFRYNEGKSEAKNVGVGIQIKLISSFSCDSNEANTNVSIRKWCKIGGK